jgi:hypothetical protein
LQFTPINLKKTNAKSRSIPKIVVKRTFSVAGQLIHILCSILFALNYTPSDCSSRIGLGALGTGLQFSKRAFSGVRKMDDGDDDAVLSFLQSIDSSDDESVSDSKKTSMAKRLHQTTAAPPMSTNGSWSAEKDKIELNGPRVTMATSYKPKMVVRGDGTQMTTRRIASSNHKMVSGPSEEAGDAKDGIAADSDDIDLASIRAVAKKEVSGAALLSCLDEVSISPQSSRRFPWP